MDELYFFLSCYFSYNAAKLEQLCFRGQRKAKVDVEYSVERTFTWGSLLQSFHFSELKFALNESLVASDSPTRLYSPRA